MIIIMLFMWLSVTLEAEYAIKGRYFEAVSCVIVSLSDAVSQVVLDTIKHDMSFLRQCFVSIDTCRLKPSKERLDYYGSKGIMFVVFLNETSEYVDWWIYETVSGQKVSAKRYLKKGMLPRGWGHQISDMLWEVIMGRPGFFSTKIAYCKEVERKRGVSFKALCIADYDGSFEEVLVNDKSIIFAPRWSYAAGLPRVFYSEEMLKNTRLMSVDMAKHIAIVTNNPGINMLLTFDKKGVQAVYSASDHQGYSQIVTVGGKGLKQLTTYAANSLGPVMKEDGTGFYFYSDAFNGSPQICKYAYDNHLITMITNQGYNTSPSYCSYTNQVVFTRLVKGIMQLYVYDEKTTFIKQLTNDAHTKEDCCFSPGGDCVLVNIKQGSMSRLALFDTIGKEYYYITEPHVFCSDPHWSPKYEEFPGLYQ